MSNNNENNLNFWDFSNPNQPLKSTDMSQAFPKEILKKEQLIKFSETLQRKIHQYKESPCFDYLSNFYNTFNTIIDLQNEIEIDKQYQKAIDEIRLFTFCWETHKK